MSTTHILGQVIATSLEPMMEDAEASGLWFYHLSEEGEEIWCSPGFLRREQADGRLIIAPEHWELRDPGTVSSIVVAGFVLRVVMGKHRHTSLPTHISDVGDHPWHIRAARPDILQEFHIVINAKPGTCGVVRAAYIRFARWLRANHEFPIRVPVYLNPGEQIVTVHGEHVSASFFAPWDRSVEPCIRVATGDYPSLKRERGRDNALAAFITSLSHEVIHYQQWIKTGDISERGVGRRAVSMLRAYEKTVDRP